MNSDVQAGRYPPSASVRGRWAVCGEQVDDRESLATLNRAVDLGVNFFDTADVYGSEPLVGQLRRQRHEPFYIATKMGMQVNPDARGYNRKNMTAFVENSLRNLGVEAIDLMQLHCPPIEVYNPEVFGILDDLVKQGQDPPLRCQRGTHCGGRKGYRIPRRTIGDDHLQYLPPAAGGKLFRASQTARGGYHRPGSAGVWDADRQDDPQHRLRKR